MPNKNYMAGRRIEYRAMKELEADGWKVIRAAGSHGEFDLVAYRVEPTKDMEKMSHVKVRFIQCKRDKKTSKHDDALKACLLINATGCCNDVVVAETWVWEHRNGWAKS